jgi:acyl carrier protein
MIEKSMQKTIRGLIDEEAKLSIPACDLDSNGDLYGVGLTPFAAIELMLALERAFHIEFPLPMLNRRSMSSISAIEACIAELERRPALRRAA